VDSSNAKIKKPQEKDEEVSTAKFVDSDYVGTYTNEGYGSCSVFSDGKGNMNFTYNNFKGSFTSRGTDIFWITTYSPVELEPFVIPVQFGRNFIGQVSSLLVPMESTLPPISFINGNYFPTDCGNLA